VGKIQLRQFVARNSRDPIFFIGTRAELIKVAPVIKRLDLADIETKVLWAGLHSEPVFPTAKHLLKFSLSEAGKDKDSIVAVFQWFLISLVRIITLGISMRLSRISPPLVVVHGDTLCTVLGGLFAKTAGAKLIHIEAGVRSGRFWRPFPEEISRRFVSLITDIHFAPGDRETNNLSRRSGEVVNTQHNTSRDALLENIEGLEFGDDGYLVVTLHRTELLSNKNQFAAVTNKILALSAKYEIRWFVGNHERKSLDAIGLLEKVKQSNVGLFERTSHEDFVGVLVRAHCVITDSGGLQSECNDLGIPVIVHRNESEYSNPDNSPYTLTHWNLDLFDEFLSGLDGRTITKGFKSEIVAAKMIAARMSKEISKG
jgi:UDP-N-acetylglucosamine 2-epimerase (non-hydrolysing)